MTSPPRFSRHAAPALFPLLVAVGCARSTLAVPADVSRDPSVVDRAASFHGWSALVIHNRHQRVTVVPAIGRVMGFDFAEAGAAPEQGPFWSHPQLGPALVPDGEGWINHGGDRAWPAPQSDWPRFSGRGWPPPATFDAQPYTASVQQSAVEMVSAVDPAYGIRVHRRVSLVEEGLLIDTRYEKVQGDPVRVAVWTISQLDPPERMFVRLPAASTFAGGFHSQLPAPPRDARVDGRLLSLARDPKDKTMLVSDGDALMWLGQRQALVIETLSQSPPPSAGDPRAWPGGAHAQIYTSPDGDQRYVELELFGPLADLRVGQSCSMLVRYQLLRRAEADPLREAQRIFDKGLAN